MLGKGWFPAQLGGLDRYYRGLISEFPEALGVVVGPGDDAPDRVLAVSDHEASLLRRLVAVAVSARALMGDMDLVDVHFALYGFLPTLVAQLRHKPVVVHFHGPWAAESLAMTGQRTSLITVKFLLERSVYRRAKLLVTLTEAFRTVLIDDYQIDALKVKVLGPGVDTDMFSPGTRENARLRFQIPLEAFVVCCARRLVPRMGIDVLLEAWGDCLASDPHAFLIISGDGPLMQQLASKVEEAGWGPRVKLIGRISDDALVDLYRAADVNVLPSRSHEGFGLTVLEAAACGTPSIVTDAGGLPEAVDGMGKDLVVTAGDAVALARRLRNARAGGLPREGDTLAWARQRDWTATANDHRSLYRSLLAAG